MTGAGGGAFELQRVLGDAKRRREELMHAQLCTACAHGDYDKVRRMLTSRSIDIDGSDFAGRCAIHLAACSGSTRVLELLIVGRADVNAEDERGVTPLTEALLADHTAAAELLVAHGGRHGSRDVSEQVCSIASSDDGATQLRRLCLFGGNVNARTHEGRTPLHVAAGEGRVANAQVLLDSKGDINVRDRHGATPLQDALLGRKDDMCAALLARGAQLGDFNAAEHMNKAVAANDLVHLSRLLRFGCAINSRDALGRTPLHLAASCRRINALSLLLDTHGIDVNAEDHFGNTPYDDALREQSAERQVIVALFASRGARLGSHVSRVVAASSARLDDERVRLADGALRAHDRTLVQAKVLSRWVREEREAVRAFKGQIEQAIRYERESGAVLADEHPELWDHIYAFAECHFDWRAEALGSVQPMIDRWRVETKEFALLTVQRLAQKVWRPTHRAHVRAPLACACALRVLTPPHPPGPHAALHSSPSSAPSATQTPSRSSGCTRSRSASPSRFLSKIHCESSVLLEALPLMAISALCMRRAAPRGAPGRAARGLAVSHP